ncbi:AAA family ATPase [Cellulomonas soli]
MAAEMTELRLKSFKSVRDATIRIHPLTLIVGRNGSGKSNILDALAVLSALATGTDLRDALDGGREGPVVRGGSQGCAPLGSDQFAIGCSVAIEGINYHLDIKIQTTPNLQIVSENLWTKRTFGPRRGEPLDLLKSEPPTPYSGDIVARWENGNRGVNPPVTMRANQLLTSQVATRVPATSQAGRRVHQVAESVIGAITSVFMLDPVPHQMREYVGEKDNHLRRNADNLSAVLRRLAADPEVRDSLLSMTRSLSEAQISDLNTVSSELGDVMVTIEEMIGGERQQVPARLMSDGTLRFLAISAAMLDTPRSDGHRDEGRLLVVEELENGLHPSQAALLLRRLKEASESRSVRTIATTHSPAILDALSGSDHESVVVSSRSADGWSRVTRLVDFPDYFEVVGRDSLGASAVKDRLRPNEIDAGQAKKSLAEILGE